MSLSFSFLRRFSICPVAKDASAYSFKDALSPTTSRIVDFQPPRFDSPSALRGCMRMLIPYAIEHAPLRFNKEPNDADDCCFWQYPATTEYHAWINHSRLSPPDWEPILDDCVHAYVGLPWATFIDRQHHNPMFGGDGDNSGVPQGVRTVFGTRLRGYRNLAGHWNLEWGKDICVHTVCQHIYWERLLPLWNKWGITDVHLSHCEPKSQAKASRYGIRTHSWPLVAANIVHKERQHGLEVGKSWRERRWLVSFIGAHMPHYRSSVRLQLRDQFALLQDPDVLYELKPDWHFNAVVYQAQIGGHELTEAQVQQERTATAHYNSVLSDSIFSLCPEGAGPNTIRLWESLAIGAIPVVIVDNWVWPTIPKAACGLTWSDAVVILKQGELSTLTQRLHHIREHEQDKLDSMQRNCAVLYKCFSEMTCF